MVAYECILCLQLRSTLHTKESKVRGGAVTFDPIKSWYEKRIIQG